MQSQKTICLKCYKRGNVLICRNSICPIVLHESCMTSIPWFDDSGRFYCPYCFYKQALVDRNLTKEKALLSKRKLVSFLDSRTSSNSTNQRNLKCLKRKNPDATNIEKMDDASRSDVEFSGVHQQVKCGHQIDSCLMETFSYTQQQAGLIKGYVWGNGNDDENSTKTFLITENEVGVSQKDQVEKEPKDASCFLVREDDAIMIDEKPNGTYDRTYQDDSSMINPKAVDVGFAFQSSNISKHQCQMTEGQVKSNSQTKATYLICEDNDSMIDQNAINPIKEHVENSKAVGQCCVGRGEKLTTEELSQDDFSLFTKKVIAMTKLGGFGEKKNFAVEDGHFLSIEMVENSEYADQPCEIRKDCFGSVDVINSPIKTSIDDIGLIRIDNVAVIQELGSLKSKHKPKKSLERYHEGDQYFKETIDDKKVMLEKSDVVSFVRKKMSIENADQIDQGQCNQNDEETTLLKLSKFVPPIADKGNALVSYEELDIADDSTSSNINYLEHVDNCWQEKKLPNNSRKSIQHAELCGYSETEAGESELSTCGKSEHKVKSLKHIQQPNNLPVARRRKLPWTVDEVEMLKAGVQRFSLMVKKNLPWLKIMDFGRHVFDGTRTPHDLKDKWKNMRGKGNANICCQSNG